MLRQIFILICCFTGSFAVWAEESGPRAKPPEWPQEVRDVFFEDVRKVLVGKRPDFGAQPQAVVDGKVKSEGGENQIWSKLIDEDSLTSEIKRTVNRVAEATTQVGKFKSEGYRGCQQDLQLLAIWLRVVSEFDEEIRWQGDAEQLASYLLTVAAKCEEGDDESLLAAREASEILTEMLRGQLGELPSSELLDAEEESESLNSLMQRMKESAENKIELATASAREFRKGRYEMVHEGQVLAVLAKVMGQESYGYSDEETYLDYAQQLQEAAVELHGAASEGDFLRVQQAGERVNDACVRCHEDYRG